MAILDRLPLSQKLLLLGVLFVASFGGFAYTAWDVVAQVGVGGPTYKDIIRSKDVVADVLPPPLYIIETHLVAHQAVATSDAARVNHIAVCQSRAVEIAAAGSTYASGK